MRTLARMSAGLLPWLALSAPASACTRCITCVSAVPTGALQVTTVLLLIGLGVYWRRGPAILALLLGMAIFGSGGATDSIWLLLPSSLAALHVGLFLIDPRPTGRTPRAVLAFVNLVVVVALAVVPRVYFSYGLCHANMANLGKALEAYAVDHGGRYPSRLSLLEGPYLGRLPRCYQAEYDLGFDYRNGSMTPARQAWMTWLSGVGFGDYVYSVTPDGRACSVSCVPGNHGPIKVPPVSLPDDTYRPSLSDRLGAAYESSRAR